MANEEPGKFQQHEEELTNLNRETEVTEARGKLAEARKKLAEAEGNFARLRQPWWRNGLRDHCRRSPLADGGTSAVDWEKQLAKFWHLYKTDLLPVESTEVEGLMVTIGGELGKCRPGQCQAIQDLSYQLARQMKGEISADASAATAPDAIVRQPDNTAAPDKP